MKPHAGSMLRFASPLKAWSQRFTLVLLIGASIALMLLDRADNVVVERSRTAVVDAISPILSVLSQPVAGVAEIIENVRELANLRQENARLREERARLLQWHSAARELDAQNQALRELLNLAPEPRTRFISARVIGNTAGPFVRSALVTAGSREGARKGQAVMTGQGFAGRVSEVGRRSARVLLLTDINSRIPVLIERTRDRAVLAGDNTNFPHLLYLPPNAVATPGDRIVTSGHGGIFPPGLPIGVVNSVSESGISVQPFVDWNRVEYVRLVDYELPGILLPPLGSDQVETSP